MKLSRCSVLDIYLGVPKKITEGGGRSHTGWNVPQYLKAQTVWWCNNRLEKYEFVNGVGIIPYMKWKIKHVWNHQPEYVSLNMWSLHMSDMNVLDLLDLTWCFHLNHISNFIWLGGAESYSFSLDDQQCHVCKPWDPSPARKKELTSAWIQRFLKKISPLHHWLVISIHLKSINCNHLSICWDQTIILGSWGLNYSPNIPIPLSFLFI